MKMKSYLKGLGTGIIITTLVFVIALKIKPNTSGISQQQTTTAASILNSTKKAVESTQAIEDESESDQEDATDNSSEDVTKENTTSENSTSKSEMVSDGASDSTKTVSVEISDAPYAETACKVLENAGIVSDWSKFNQYLMDSGYEKLIRNGTYDLYPGEDFESIAKTITGRK